MSRELFEKWRNGKNDPSAGCDCDYDYWAAGFQSGHAAGLEQQAKLIAELSTHPCLTEDGGFDHDWEFVDDSFDHEFGTHIEHYYRCKCCNALKDADGDADEWI